MRNRRYELRCPRRRWNLFTPALALALSAATPPILIENRGRQSVYNLYAVPEGGKGWGKDRLDDATIPPGRNREVTIAHPARQCRYRVRLVLADRRELVRAIDLCRGGRWTIGAEGESFEPGAPPPR